MSVSSVVSSGVLECRGVGVSGVGFDERQGMAKRLSEQYALGDEVEILLEQAGWSGGCAVRWLDFRRRASGWPPDGRCGL